VIHVSFKNTGDMDRFIATMENSGFPLPEDVPDETFKPAKWMDDKEPS
jgi:hypothetical protein